MKALIDMGLVVDALIVIKKHRQDFHMWKNVNQSNLPKGFKFNDLNNLIDGLEDVKITAKEMNTQLMVNT